MITRTRHHLPRMAAALCTLLLCAQPPAARAAPPGNDLISNAEPVVEIDSDYYDFSGSLHGTTAGSTVNQVQADAGEPPHGSPASTTSVWYAFTPIRSGPISFTCAQALVEVYAPGSFAPLATSLYDPSVSAWRCTFKIFYGQTFLICLSNPGAAAGGPFDLKWEAASIITPSSSGAMEGTDLHITIRREANWGEPVPPNHPLIRGSAVIAVRAVERESQAAYPAQATAGVDFDDSVHLATFLPGEATTTVSIPLFTDHMHEFTEAFTIKVSCLQGNVWAPVLSSRDLPDLTIGNADPYVPVTGTYQAAVWGGGIVFVTATLSTVRLSSGALGTRVTGVFMNGLQPTRFTTSLDDTGYGDVTFKQPGNPKPVNLTLKIWSSDGGRSLLFLQQFDGQTYGDFIIADRAAYNARTDPAPVFGNYTAVMTNAAVDLRGAAAPRCSIATVKVSTGGIMSIAGMMGDGATFSGSCPLHLAARASRAKPHGFFSIPLYGTGWLRADVQFDSTLGDGSDFRATCNWAKTSSRGSSAYLHPICAAPVLAGQRYTAPPPGVRAMPGLDSAGTFALGISEDKGATTSTTLATCWWLVNNRINTASFSQLQPGLHVALVVYPATGLITGTIAQPPLFRTALPLRAVIQQGTDGLQGFYLNARSQVSHSVFRQ